MNDMVDLILIMLCVIGLIGSVILAGRRYRFFGVNTLFHRRLLLVDLMIVLTMVELTLDAIAESTLVVDPLRTALHLLAVAGRGAVVTGVVALLLSFPGDEDEERKQ